jgi:hypothetical protein
VLVGVVAFLPFLLPPPPEPRSEESSSQVEPDPGSPPGAQPEDPSHVATSNQRGAATGDERIPPLPPLNESTATPALLSRAKALATEHPGEAWLQQYVVNTHYWLARRSQDEHRFREALSYLDDSQHWGAAAGDAATYRAFIYRDQLSWTLAEKWARVAITEGSQIDPAEMHHIVGQACYFREEFRRAVEELEMALEIRDAPHIRASLELAMRDARASSGYSRRRLSHFIVSYEGDVSESTGRMAMDTLERSYASLVSRLGFEPREPVSVILYPRRSYRGVGGDDRHHTGGLFDGKIRLPISGVHWGNDYIRRTLSHELAHAFFYSRTGGHDPRWLNEGLAEYVQGERTTDFANKQQPPGILDNETLEGCLLTSRYDCELFYPAAASVVDYMIQLRGMGGVRDVLSRLDENDTIDDALERVYARDERNLIADWKEFVRRRP